MTTRRFLILVLLTAMLIVAGGADLDGPRAYGHPVYSKAHVDYHIGRYQDFMEMQANTNRILRQRARAQAFLGQRLAPWRNLKACETHGIYGWAAWRYNGKSGFDGALQFHPKTWRDYGGDTFKPYAWQATPIQQMAIAQKVLAKQGRMAWPGCTEKGAW